MRAKYILRIFLIVFFGSLFNSSKAALKMGGEIFYSCHGNNQYEVTVRVYRLCVEGTQTWDLDSVINLFVFKGDRSIFNIKSISLLPTQRDTIPIDRWLACMVDPKLTCMEVANYTTTIYLPPSPGGYDLSWATCCRWGGTINMKASHQGLTLTSHVPDPGIYPCNSSPEFSQLPPLFLCANEILDFDFSAKDVDGDSLAYQLSVPLQGLNQDSVGIAFPQWFASLSNPIGAPPYQKIQFREGYDVDNDFGVDGICEIDPRNGRITLMPTLRYDFLLSVSVFEYRNGVLIGESRRDFQFKCNNCVDMGMAPTVSHDYGNLNLVQDTIQVQPNETFCFQATFSDTARDDQIITREWGPFRAYDFTSPLLDNPAETIICWNAFCESQEKKFPIIIYARDTADCPYYKETYDTTWVRVNSPVFIQPTPTIKFPASQSQNDTLNTLPGVPMCFQLQLNDLDETGKIDIKTIKEILSTDSMIYQYTLQTIDNGINICLSTNCGYPPYLTTILLPVSDSGQCGQLFNWEDTVWIQTQACNINFPNVFTPNQDGINDLFQPFELNGVTIISLEIYDRWGHQIYEDRLSPISWDGLNTQRKLASEGIYFYVFTYKETGIIPTRIQIKRGQVTLLR